MSIRNVKGIWYYSFMVEGKRYYGTCRDQSGQPVKTERAAQACERTQRAELGNVRANKSVKALVENYREELIRWAQGMTGNRDTAHELVQEGFVRALDNEEVICSLRESQARAWLYRTIKNLYIDRIRHLSRESVTEQIPEDIASSYTAEEYAELEIAELLQQLPSLDRKLFVLRYIEGYNATKLSEIYGLPPGTVRARLSHARALLRKALTG